MVEHTDRVAMQSDLEALEARLSARLDARLEGRLKDTLSEVRALIAEEGVRLEGRLKESLAEVRGLIEEEGLTTRRHFDIMVERMAELMKPLADGVSHHSTVLDDHESRLQQLEK